MSGLGHESRSIPISQLHRLLLWVSLHAMKYIEELGDTREGEE